ncbi:MAG TPA: hypothetical protein DCM28_00090 [Phycisphaerales bacterium]|nr:hypothetical protein [Phycisphaerales bacterium]HCD30928.1 hypothetical protein [Phycisphaerales bacterium]|tara:strand:- start:2376 stop:3107 length:732 start_codon:yes stop_codon:yes gene_type:complete
MNRDILRQLVVKELRESLSGLALGLFLLGTFTAVAVQSRLIPDQIVIVILALMSIVLAILWGMSPIGSERQQGTMGMLLSLPIAAWQVLLVKIGVALACVLLPVFLSWCLFTSLAGGRELENAFINQAYFGMGLLNVVCLIWTICLGIRQPSEARVLMVVLGVFFGGWALLALISQLHLLPTSNIRHLFLLTPIGLLTFCIEDSFSAYERNMVMQSMIANALVIILLFVYAGYQLNRPNRTRG